MDGTGPYLPFSSLPDLTVATRHLSAASYVDDHFRRRVLREIVDNRTRATAPEFGIDPATVVAHGRRATVLRLTHGVALLATVAAFVFLAPYATALLLFVGLVALAFRNVVLRVILLVFLGLVLVPCVVAVAFQPATMAGLVGEIVGGLGDVAEGTGDFAVNVFREGPTFASTGALLGILAAVTILVAAARTALLTGLAATPLAARPPLRRFPADADLVIYSGTQPFVGSGNHLRAGRFSFALRPADTALGGPPPTPFTTGELVGHLRAGVAGLSASRIDGLTVTDQAFLAGVSALSTSRHIDAHFGRPGVMASVIAQPSPGLRHCLRCQIVAWSGEGVTTVYVHAVVEGEVLHLECATFLLPPTRGEFQVFGARRKTGVPGFLRTAPALLVRAPADALVSPGVIIGAIRDLIPYGSGGPGQPGRIDRGARVSIRELGTGLVPPHYFQQRDVLRHAEILERRVFAEAVAFLAARGFDTGELDRRAGAFINHGVVNVGPGTINIGAVGQYAEGEIRREP